MGDDAIGCNVDKRAGVAAVLARVSAEALAAALVKLTPRPPQAWQCSGCRRVYFGRYRTKCPDCDRVEYWTGSVEREALKAADAARDRTPEEQAYDTIAEALADLADAEARAERAETVLAEVVGAARAHVFARQAFSEAWEEHAALVAVLARLDAATRAT